MKINIFKKKLLPVVIATFSLSTMAASSHLSANSQIDLQPLGTYKTNQPLFTSAQEIVAFDKQSKRLFVVNGGAKTIDILKAGHDGSLLLIKQVDITPYGKAANSVSVHHGVVAAAVQNNNKQQPGQVVFFNVDGEFLNKLTVGAQPDMVTFTPNGKFALVANEGEPSDDYSIDPEGSVSVVRMLRDVKLMTQNNVKTADFKEFNKRNLPKGIKISGPGASVAQDLEPEYITVSEDSETAWVTLQENNAIAEIDIADAEIEKIFSLGFKDHSLPGNELDVSNKDGKINIKNWPVFGAYQPDSIAAYQHGSKTYLVTANEGDGRDYPGHSEETRVMNLSLNPEVFPDAQTLQLPENLGRLKVTTAIGDVDKDGYFEELYSYGARSFSIWNESGQLIFDSANDFEKIIARDFPGRFNSQGSHKSFDSRSDDKGPEPEALALGKVAGRTYAFIGLERVGGIMVYDITNPLKVKFIQYQPGNSTDISPEGIKFISAKDSPTGKPVLAVAFEASGTTTLFEINRTARK